MGRVGQFIAFARETIRGAQRAVATVSLGKGWNVTAEHFQPSGDDSQPMSEDYVYLARDPRTGRFIVVGYIDADNAGVTGPGEKRIYSRDAQKVPVAQVWCKNDGTIIMSNDEGVFTLTPSGSISGSNDQGSFNLQTGGNFVVNGAVIDTNGNITSPGQVACVTGVASTSFAAPSVLADGKEIAGHDHPQNNGNDNGGGVNTGVNN